MAGGKAARQHVLDKIVGILGHIGDINRGARTNLRTEIFREDPVAGGFVLENLGSGGKAPDRRAGKAFLADTPADHVEPAAVFPGQFATAFDPQLLPELGLSYVREGGILGRFIDTAFVGAGASEALVPYHDIYRKYLDNADMVSIQLGGNDIVMGIIYPMIKSDNPILNDTATAVALLLFGRTPEEAIGAGAKLIIRDKDKITSAHVAEAVKFFSAIKNDAEKYVENSANNVESVVSAVEDVNPDADIALIGMYNPYGNSLEYQGQVRDACTVMKNMFVRAVDEAVDINIEVGDVEIVPVQEAEQKSEDLKQVSFSLQKYLVDNSYFKEMKKERLKALLTIAADELSYPIQYLTAGKNVDPQMRLLNEKLQVIAENHGATYVNVYDISNECNTDPHPTVEGHKEIADRLEAAMADTILEKMSAVDPEPEKVVLLGDVDGDGEVTVMDALAMQKYVSDKPVKDFVVEAADINGDGVVDTNDTILIQKYTAGKTVKYPIGEPING